MIILRNYATTNTCIQIEDSGYKVVGNKCKIRNGIGGFSEDGDLLGVYIENDKLYFQCNEKHYEAR